MENSPTITISGAKPSAKLAAESCTSSSALSKRRVMKVMCSAKKIAPQSRTPGRSSGAKAASGARGTSVRTASTRAAAPSETAYCPAS